MGRALSGFTDLVAAVVLALGLASCTSSAPAPGGTLPAARMVGYSCPCGNRLQAPSTQPAPSCHGKSMKSDPR